MNSNSAISSESIDNFHPLLLNVGYATHHSDWNWQHVSSPFIRIFYVTHGNAKVILPDGTFDLSPGHMYMIPAFVLHSYSCDGDFSLYYLHIYEDNYPLDSMMLRFKFPFEIEAAEADSALIHRLVTLNPSMEIPHSNPTTYDNKQSLHDSIHRNKQRSIGLRIESRGILYQIISRFVSNATLNVVAHDERICNAIDIILGGLDRNFTVEDLAGRVFLSKNHFLRLFKKETGTTPIHYINQKKIERAQLLLLSTAIPVKELAYGLGFSDYSYFIRIFRKSTGLTPLDYRRAH